MKKKDLINQEKKMEDHLLDYLKLSSILLSIIISLIILCLSIILTFYLTKRVMYDLCSFGEYVQARVERYVKNDNLKDSKLN